MPKSRTPGVLPESLSPSRIGARVVLSLLTMGLIGCHLTGKVAPVKRETPPPAETMKALPDTDKRDGLAPAGPDRVTFADITDAAGIRFTHFSGARGKKYMPECETPGCAFLDFNNDGRPDILLLNGADWPEVTSGRKKTLCAL